LRTFVLACVWCLVSLVPVHAASAPPRMAVVNVSFVFEKYAKVAEVQRAIDESFRARKTELQQRGEELGKRNRELEQLYGDAKTTEAVFDAVQRLRHDQFTFEHDAEQLSREMQELYSKEMREVLSDIRYAIKKVAEDRHFDLVLRSPDADDPAVSAPDPTKPLDPKLLDKKTYLEVIEPKTVVEVLERFHRNPVLYGKEASDITQEVLDHLNAEHMKRTVLGVKKDAKNSNSK